MGLAPAVQRGEGLIKQIGQGGQVLDELILECAQEPSPLIHRGRQCSAKVNLVNEERKCVSLHVLLITHMNVLTH
jgi:hypothetical protein